MVIFMGGTIVAGTRKLLDRMLIEQDVFSPGSRGLNAWSCISTWVCRGREAQQPDPFGTTGCISGNEWRIIHFESRPVARDQEGKEAQVCGV